MIHHNGTKMWTVVSVHSGIPTEVRHFNNKCLAIEYEEKTRNNMNLEKDETGIFEASIKRQRL